MNNFITDKIEFEKARSDTHNFLDFKKELPENIFNTGYGNYLFFVFEDIFTEEFFDFFINFLKLKKERYFCFYTIEPDAKEYFFKNYGFYNAFKLSIESTYEDYINLLNNYPKNNLADSMISNSNQFLIFSSYKHLFFYCNRDLEMAVMVSDELSNVFKENPFNSYVDVNEFIEEIKSLKYGSGDIPKDILLFYQSLEKNYGNLKRG